VRVGGKFTLLPALPPSQAVSERSGEKRVQEAAPHILLIAGGVGINPLYSMLLQLAATGGRLSKPEMHGCSSSSSASVSLQPHVTLLWSIRTLQDAFLLPQLRALASSVGGSDSPLAGRLRLILALTRQRAAADEGIGLCDASEPMLVSGRISPVLLQGLLRAAADGDFKLSSSKIFAEQSYAQHSLPVVSSSATRPPGSHHAFVCGPPSMTECVAAALNSKLCGCTHMF
jgi:predicted ferric reductase